ncbi:DUF4283 domain-containing protein [Raphanus sativus]|nr:DUF4283 domain-containing protein [Raphanus sativus]
MDPPPFQAGDDQVTISDVSDGIKALSSSDGASSLFQNETDLGGKVLGVSTGSAQLVVMEGDGVSADKADGSGATQSVNGGLGSYAEVVREVLPGDDRYIPEFVVKDGVADVSVPEDLIVDVDPLWKCFVPLYE